MSQRNYRQIRTSRANDVSGTIVRTLNYLSKGNVFKLFMIVLCIIISALTGVISSYFFTPIINDYVVPYIGDNNPDLSGFIRMLVVMAIVYIAGVISSYTYRKLMSVVSTGMLHSLRKDLFAKMQKLPLSFFDSHTHGEMMVYYTNDIDTMRPMVAETLPQTFSTLITLSGCFIMMGILNFRLMLVVFGMLIIISILTYILANTSRGYFKGLQKYVSDLNGYVEEMFSGQKVIKVFNHEEITADEFHRITEELYKVSFKTNAYASILWPVNGNLAYVAYALVAVVGAKFCIEGTMSLGVLASFLMYVRQFTGPISQISQQFNSFMMALAGAERVFNLMDADSELDYGIIELVNVEEGKEELIETNEKSHRWAWKIPVDPPKLVELKGDVRLENVNFSYVEGKPILKNVSLYANPGEKIALVGSTGAGKTTITNLLNRFYDVKDEDGMIFFDGIPIKEIKKDDLRKSIGMVLQDTNLFSGTVMENIRYGKLDASDEQCIEAAKRCNADSFIKRLPQGYQTMLTANGSNLSQGQRQLLNIARCAVADPPVMILDEATSSIDTHTEKLIEKGMDELMKGRTTFVIAHRLSTVRNANAIIVLEGGEIIERGTHEDLIELKGRYYQLYTGKAELD